MHQSPHIRPLPKLLPNSALAPPIPATHAEGHCPHPAQAPLLSATRLPKCAFLIWLRLWYPWISLQEHTPCPTVASDCHCHHPPTGCLAHPSWTLMAHSRSSFFPRDVYLALPTYCFWTELFRKGREKTQKRERGRKSLLFNFILFRRFLYAFLGQSMFVWKTAQHSRYFKQDGIYFR